MSETKSDLSTATLGFFGGAIVLAAILWGVSVWTTAQFAAHEAAPAAEHRAP